MIINLYDVLSVVGNSKSVSASFEEQDILFYGESMKVFCKEPFQVTVSHSEKDMIQIGMELEVCTTRPCGRCLEDVDESYSLKVNRNIIMDKKEAYTDNKEESEPISYIEDCTLDVDMLILDELYTVIPMNVLCKEDCKGICKVCGTNLNKSTCECDQTVPDPRMAVFNDIFNQFKEV